MFSAPGWNRDRTSQRGTGESGGGKGAGKGAEVVRRLLSAEAWGGGGGRQVKGR